MSKMSVCLFICPECLWNVITQCNKKWILANDRIARCLGYLHAKADLDRSKDDQWVWKNVEFCTLAVCVQWLACRTISACAEPIV